MSRSSTLFADTPPSTTNSANNYYYTPYQQQNYGYNPYGPPDARTSFGSNGFGNPQGPMYPNPYVPRQPQGAGRDEILMVSDDRVMRLQMSPRALQ